MAHKSAARTIDPGVGVPYTRDMANKKTMPPGPADAEAADFEQAIKTEGEYWARARAVRAAVARGAR